MNGGFNRRDFMKTAGVTAAGFAVASGYSPLTYGQNNKICVGCIGVGGQGSFHIREGLTKNDVFQITAISDVYSPNQQMALRLAQLASKTSFTVIAPLLLDRVMSCLVLIRVGRRVERELDQAD